MSQPVKNTRRTLLKSALAGAAGLSAAAQTPQRDWSGQNPVRYPDPDLVIVDPRFAKYRIFNTPLRRLYTGALWAEGPAWSGVGRYLVWSDIPNNRQMRWLEDDGQITTYNAASNNTNGNTFDWQGRLLSCEHLTRRVVRREHSGKMTVLADSFNGKRFNAPNDIVVHPNGDIWFTDPGYGILVAYEGELAPLELKESVYRIDGKSGKVSMVTDELFKPTGLCFSPDYKKLYVVDTGFSHYPKAPKNIRVYDVANESTLRNGKEFTSMALANVGTGNSDGIRADIDGNIWAGAAGVGAGYDGVHVFAPNGDRIGMILLPETCANVCFGGPRRNRLFMTAGQSLYAVYVETQGAHIC